MQTINDAYWKQEDIHELAEFMRERGGWWHRAWTFQEASLGSKLVFFAGAMFQSDHIERYCAFSVLSDSNTDKLKVRDAMEAMDMMKKMLATRRNLLGGEKEPLLDLVMANRHRNATDPRDLFYAYVGLANDVPPDFVQYDLPLGDWFVYITVKMIQQSHTLEVLQYARAGIGGEHADHEFRTIPKRPSKYVENEPSDPIDRFAINQESLEEYWLDVFDNDRHRFWNQLKGYHYPFTSEETIQEAFKKVLTSNKPVFKTERTVRAWEDIIHEWFDQPEKHSRSSQGWTEYLEAKTGIEEEFLTQERRPVISEKGYLGWGPIDTKVGDLITVLHGAKIPFILRRNEEKANEAVVSKIDCTLMGEAYVHGLMYGEALKAVEEGKLHQQMFSLQ
ncbi:hypothetical protein PG984_002934 [Apiospora sp. TS-2023a]